MAIASTSYVSEREGVLYVGDSRVTVSSLAMAWRNEGYTPEELQLGFPSLSLAQVYGAIAYYLDHRQELDAQFATDDERYWRHRARDRDADPEFYRRLEKRKAHLRRQIAVRDGTDEAGSSRQ